MVLEYGNKKIVRFMYDNSIEKLAIELQEEIVEGGVVVAKLSPTIVARGAEYHAMMARLFPEGAPKDKAALESEFLLIAAEQKQSKKGVVEDGK